jgi:hypothetical protein
VLVEPRIHLGTKGTRNPSTTSMCLAAPKKIVRMYFLKVGSDCMLLFAKFDDCSNRWTKYVLLKI